MSTHEIITNWCVKVNAYPLQFRVEYPYKCPTCGQSLGRRAKEHDRDTHHIFEDINAHLYEEHRDGTITSEEQLSRSITFIQDRGWKCNLKHLFRCPLDHCSRSFPNDKMRRHHLRGVHQAFQEIGPHLRQHNLSLEESVTFEKITPTLSRCLICAQGRNCDGCSQMFLTVRSYRNHLDRCPGIIIPEYAERSTSSDDEFYDARSNLRYNSHSSSYASNPTSDETSHTEPGLNRKRKLAAVPVPKVSKRQKKRRGSTDLDSTSSFVPLTSSSDTDGNSDSDNISSFMPSPSLSEADQKARGKRGRTRRPRRTVERRCTQCNRNFPSALDRDLHEINEHHIFRELPFNQYHPKNVTHDVQKLAAGRMKCITCQTDETERIYINPIIAKWAIGKRPKKNKPSPPFSCAICKGELPDFHTLVFHEKQQHSVFRNIAFHLRSQHSNISSIEELRLLEVQDIGWQCGSCSNTSSQPHNDSQVLEQSQPGPQAELETNVVLLDRNEYDALKDRLQEAEDRNRMLESYDLRLLEWGAQSGNWNNPIWYEAASDQID